MKTPCIAACKNVDGICSGCHRTMNEIVQWQHITEQERDQAMANLLGMNSSHLCPSCGEPAQCDISQGKDSCWCFELDRRDTRSIEKSNECLCRKCMAKLPLA